MHDEPESTQGPWMMYFTLTLLALPVLYALSSGPMRIGCEMLGKSAETHEAVYAPLVWLGATTPTSGLIGWYWDLFPTRPGKWNVNRGEYHDEYDIVGREERGGEAVADDPLGKWLNSPKARAINWSLGLED